MTVRMQPPTAKSLVRGFRNAHLTWQKALGELIDNACGNGAQTVTVRLTQRECEIRDDGVGCTEEKFAALGSIGWHEEDPVIVNPTSKYGIGAKHAFLWVGGPTRLYSRRGDLALCTEIDWDSFGADFEYQDPLVGPLAEKECASVGLAGSGVCVVMPRHGRRINRHSFDQLHKALNAQHWAAVEAGIVVRVEFRLPGTRKKIVGGVLTGKAMPEFIEGQTVDRDVSLSDGRVIRLRGGVLAPHVAWSSPGFEYIYGHRVVITACGLGAGEKNFERVYVRVFLAGDKSDWNVTTNKQGLHDADEAALQEVVYRECGALLERSEQESLTTRQDEDLLEEVSDALSGGNRKRAKRGGDSGQAGTVLPKDTKRRHRKAERLSEHPGECESKSAKRPARIDVLQAAFDEDNASLIGQAYLRDRKVRLNTRHPIVSGAISARNKLAILVIADAIWSDTWVTVEETGQRKLDSSATFIEKLSAMLSVVPEVEGSTP